MRIRTRRSVLKAWGATLALALLVTEASAATLDARASVRASQFQPYVTALYAGDATGFTGFTVFTSDPPDPARYARAEVSTNAMSVQSHADDSGAPRPDGFAHLFGFELRFEDNAALQSALAASPGGRLDLVARFDAAATLLNTPNPQTGVLSGPFNQTISQSEFDINVRGLAPTTVSGLVKGSNGPFEAYDITTQGVLTADRLNAGFFAIDVPFSIDATHLATTFDMEMSSFSLSLDLLTSSSVALRMPTAGDVFLVSGESAAALGLVVNSTAVPLPAGAWLLLSGVAALAFRRRAA